MEAGWSLQQECWDDWISIWEKEKKVIQAQTLHPSQKLTQNDHRLKFKMQNYKIPRR